MSLAAVVGAVPVGSCTDICADSDTCVDKLSVRKCAASADNRFGVLEGRTVAYPFIVKGVVNGVGVNVALPAEGLGTCCVVSDIESVGACHFGGTERRLGLAAAAAAGIKTNIAVEYLRELLGKLGRRGKVICVHLTCFIDMGCCVNLIEFVEG